MIAPKMRDEKPIFGADVLTSTLSPTSAIDADYALAAVLVRPAPGRRTRLLTATIACATLVVIAGLIVWGWGYRSQRHNPGFWQVSLTAMLFWLSVSQGMMALSCILRLCHASWRYQINRLLDIASLFGLWVVALLPFLVVARHSIYGLGAASYGNNVWRVAGSAYIDCFAIGIAYIAGWLLLFLTSLPDFAMLAARAEPGSKRWTLFGRLSSSRLTPEPHSDDNADDYKRSSSRWVGDSLQWQTLRRAEGVLVVGVLIAFVASQTIIGWDFQLASARNWDSSIFAPLYTLGSLLSATAMLVLVGTAANYMIPAANIMQTRHYESLARLLLALGLIWFYFRFCDYLTAWYEKVPEDWHIEGKLVTSFPVLTLMMFLGCFAIPVFANMFKPIRTSKYAQCVVAVCVLTGLAVQRYLDTLPTFAPNYPLSALVPTFASAFVFIGLAAMFVLTYLLAARYIPVMSWWGTAKETTRTAERRLGNANVTVMAEDPPAWET